MTYELEGARVRVSAPAVKGMRGEVIRYYPATEQYLVSLPEIAGVIWVPTRSVEVLA